MLLQKSPLLCSTSCLAAKVVCDTVSNTVRYPLVKYCIHLGFVLSVLSIFKNTLLDINTSRLREIKEKTFILLKVKG